MPSREPWATMPADGSGTASTAERVVTAILTAACTLVLVWVAWLVWSPGTASAPPASAPAAGSAPVRDAGTVLREADLIMRGGSWSQETAKGCAAGPAACDVALREVNGEASLYGLMVMEDGSIAVAGKY